MGISPLIPSKEERKNGRSKAIMGVVKITEPVVTKILAFIISAITGPAAAVGTTVKTKTTWAMVRWKG